MAGCSLLFIVLLHAWAPAVPATRVAIFEHNSKADPPNEECGRTVAEPPTGQDLQSYFDDLRQKYGILSLSSSLDSGLVNPEACTKKDVCLLMRQLDMDFYQRARAGTLTDHDYDTPPTLSWFESGNCESDQGSRGYPVQSVMDYKLCSRAANQKVGNASVVQTNSTELPTGCVIVHNKQAGSKTTYMNIGKTNVAAGMAYKRAANQQMVPTNNRFMQLCIMDRSLSESAASYYSPYKLKPSMNGNEGHSTSCSFGMMAFLARLQETKSPCAKIITYRTNPNFSSAAHALQTAEALKKEGEAGEKAATKILQYVETVRQKNVLLETIANQWCPGVWTAAKATPGATCDAPRVMSWTEDGARMALATTKKNTPTETRPRGRQPKGGNNWAQAGNQGLLDDLLKEEDVRAADLKEHKDADTEPSDSNGKSTKLAFGKPIKIALNDASCDAFEDESLASVLVRRPKDPPDWFGDAKVVG